MHKLLFLAKSKGLHEKLFMFASNEIIHVYYDEAKIAISRSTQDLTDYKLLC